LAQCCSCDHSLSKIHVHYLSVLLDEFLSFPVQANIFVICKRWKTGCITEYPMKQYSFLVDHQVLNNVVEFMYSHSCRSKPVLIKIFKRMVASFLSFFVLIMKVNRVQKTLDHIDFHHVKNNKNIFKTLSEIFYVLQKNVIQV